MISLQSVDIAIGMVVVFLTVSLVCSSINEFIAAMLRLRANTLRNALESLLGSTLAKKVIDHPVIPAAPSGGEKRPAYIEPALFATALLNSLAPGPAADVAAAIAAPAENSVLANSPAQIALSSLLQAANGDYVKFRDQVATWFDAYMGRVSGAYKRTTQIFIAVIAIVVVGILNVDTFKIYKQLISQPAVAQALAAQSGPLLKEANNPQTGLTVGADLDKINARIASLPIPIGWHLKPGQDDTVIPWWQKAIGLIITIIAAALGAPFWFDALGKLANLRSVGPKPEST